MRVTLAVSSALLLASLAGCGASPPPLTSGPGVPPPVPASPPAAPLITETSLASVGLDAEAMDRSIDPCADFYSYACGGWMKKTEIPGDQAIWARSFGEIERRNQEVLRGLLEEAARTPKVDDLTKRLGSYYAACMDEDGAEQAGVKPILPLVAEARRVKDAKGVAALVTKLHQRQLFAIFSVSAAQDFKDATRVITSLDQAGLGLPDRSYYLEDDDKAKAARDFYRQYVERMMLLVGLPEKGAKQAAIDVLRLETELARASKTRVERRDPKGLYNKVDRKGLARLAPRFAWDSYFEALGLGRASDVNVTSTGFFEGVNELLASTPASVWQSYLSFRVVDGSAMLLSRAFVDEKFRMVAFLTGQKELRPRWKRCVDATDSAMGEALAQPFVKARFPGESKDAAERMVKAIARAFAEEAAQVDWLSGPTRDRALQKLGAMEYLIGYPDKWKTYDFPIGRSYAENALAARAAESRRELAKIGKPLDRQEWQTSPPAVNAYYDPQRNHMVFPAGILQPPFYDVKASIPVNLGAIGMVVGHELTHGFDDEGAQFDDSGNLADWWEPAVGQRFAEKAACVEGQYGAYEALPGLKLNGKLTLGGNIADMGGLRLAYAAYRALRKGAAELLVAEGLSEEQQFFLSHAQAWCAKSREEFDRMMVQVNPHSPPRFRVNGPLSNMREFAEAYQCKEGAPLRPARTCTVW
jgi:putative endopeptidase